MADIYDIVLCPICLGAKEVDGGQVMKDARIYSVKKQCQTCHGRGRILVKRMEGTDEDNYRF